MIGHLYIPLFRRVAPPPPPSNGPSGGASWLWGYTPKHRVLLPTTVLRRRSRRDEILFLT
jgi:hypothetical protein